MKRLVLIAALCAVMAQQPGWAAEKARAARVECYSQSAIEAEQAIRFLTDVMVISSTCQDTVYAEVRLRTRDPIMAYQNEMIAPLHDTPAFDRWNTSIANQASSKHAGQPSVLVCQQAADLLKQASVLDPPKFREFAATQATAGRSRRQAGGRPSQAGGRWGPAEISRVRGHSGGGGRPDLSPMREEEVA